ncbi:MAG: cupredoxin domain-containing protein [Acetobacteraceae bacterium]
MARRVAAAAGIAALLAAGTPARAEDTFSLTIRNHRFEPDRLEVPANTKFKLQVKNTDAAAEEFESHSLKREKIVPAGGTVTLSIGPLKPGEYKFFGEYHESTAQGVLVAK